MLLAGGATSGRDIENYEMISHNCGSYFQNGGYVGQYHNDVII